MTPLQATLATAAICVTIVFCVVWRMAEDAKAKALEREELTRLLIDAIRESGHSSPDAGAEASTEPDADRPAERPVLNKGGH